MTKSLLINNSRSEITVGKILCLGRNYAEHVKEMNAKLMEEPVIFSKPTSALIRNGEPICFPSISQNLHHEVELVIVIGKTGKNIPETKSLDHIMGYAVGLDMTLRDVQSKAKKEGLPWTVAKGFDTSAPVSDIIPKQEIPDPAGLTITCRVNGSVRQKSSTRNMIMPVGYIIAYISSIFKLETGDLIFTGTPEGVGPVQIGDIVEAEIEGLIKTAHRVTACE
jgi:2-keto-4-pentenoate hydratase/2-oxohepta-3-ene-1,7-dioic acid hydratase in catechol pathway